MDLPPETLAALAGGEWLLLCQAEAEGAVLNPAVFATDDGRVALAFRGEADLVRFTERPAAYAALPGRALVSALVEAGLGLGLNFGADDAALLPAPALRGLHRLWAAPLAESQGGAAPPPPGPPPALPKAARGRLAALLAQGLPPKVAAYLYGQGAGAAQPGLAILGAPARAEAALTRLARESWQMAGLPPGPLALVLLAATHPEAESYRHLGAFLAEGAPEPAPPEVAPPLPPGMDPAHPPILRFGPKGQG